MKKSLSIILAILFMLTAAACGGNKSTITSKAGSSTTEKTEDTADSSKPQKSSKNNDTVSADGNTLVVYFSATGSTEAVAKVISETKKAKLYELLPENPYTDDDLDYTNDKSRVCVEHNDSKRSVPLKNGKIPDFEKYSTVYIGYPIWWGEAAWPLETFVKENDFTGKTVIPFCTSVSSGVGSSGEHLKELSNGGNWESGQRFSSDVDTSTVVSWLQ